MRLSQSVCRGIERDRGSTRTQSTEFELEALKASLTLRVECGVSISDLFGSEDRTSQHCELPDWLPVCHFAQRALTCHHSRACAGRHVDEQPAGDLPIDDLRRVLDEVLEADGAGAHALELLGVEELGE